MLGTGTGHLDQTFDGVTEGRELWDVSLEAWLLLAGVLAVVAAILFLTDVVLPGHGRSREWRSREASPRVVTGENEGEALLDQSLALAREAERQHYGGPSLEQTYRNPHIGITPRGVQRADGQDVDAPS